MVLKALGNFQYWCWRIFQSVKLWYSQVLNCSLQASSLECSVGGAGKVRRACNYMFIPAILNISIKNVDAKWWLTEMTLVRTSLLLAHVFQCLFTFRLVSPLRLLVEIWQLSWQGAAGELEVEFMYQRHSCKQAFSQTLKTGHPEGMFSHKIIRD